MIENFLTLVCLNHETLHNIQEKVVSSYDSWNVPRLTQPYTRLKLVHIFYCVHESMITLSTEQYIAMIQNETYSSFTFKPRDFSRAALGKAFCFYHKLSSLKRAFVWNWIGISCFWNLFYESKVLKRLCCYLFKLNRKCF